MECRNVKKLADTEIVSIFSPVYVIEEQTVSFERVTFCNFIKSNNPFIISRM